MSTVRLSGHEVGDRAPGAERSLAVDSSRAAASLAVALLILCLYAAFAHGAVSPTDTQRLQLALAVVCAGTACAWLWNGSIHVHAPRRVWAGLVLLTAFAVWSGLTLLWSVAPNQTWAECNRVITYLLVLSLAIAYGASDRRAVERVTGGLLAATLLVTAYALGQKLFPGLHLGGLIQLDQTGGLPRLQEPFGYWNALALFVAFGVPPALAMVVDRDRTETRRLTAAVAISCMLVVIAFTYSRGGLLALVCGLGVGLWVSQARLRSLMWLALTILGALPAVLLGLSSHALTASGVDLGDRELAGIELAAVLVASLTLMVMAARSLQARERRTSISASQARQIGVRLVRACGLVVVIGLLLLTVSSRGLTGSFSHAWDSFTTTHATSVYNPSRLLSTDSENRWGWWQEAARAFAHRPIAGWGAGSFGVLNLLYRHDGLTVQQPHSLPLQFLSETGLIGTALAGAAFALLLAAGLAAVRRRHEPRARLLAASLLAVAGTYFVHTLFDWDWDIPGVTLPALIVLGVLVAHGEPVQPYVLRRPSSPNLRAAAIAATTFALCVFGLSVTVPRLAAADAAQALVRATANSPAALRSALSTALLASRLDPVSDSGLLAASTIEAHLGDDRSVRRDLLAALSRQPTDETAWERLAYADVSLRDPADALIAARQALALDPRGAAGLLTREIAALLAREQRSGSTG
jgi:hypothetical protein